MDLKILYIGGQKSGKSFLASKKALEIASKKPYYLATYDNSYNDQAMQERIQKHIDDRRDDFNSIEESHDLTLVIQENETYLVDCISMWLFNNIEQNEDTLYEQLEHICQKNTNIVFVLNEVNSGVIPMDKLSRKFVDMTGLIGQKLVQLCDEVYEAKFGLEVKLK